MNNDLIYPLENDAVSSAFHTFSSNIRNSVKNINWFYTKSYQGNIPNSIEDSRDFHHAFDDWIKNCEPWIKKDSTAIDIGAFNGDTTLPIAYLVGENGKVLSFEPHPDNFKELTRNVLINPCINVDFYNSAIMEYEGYYDFYYNTDSNKCKNGGLSEWVKMNSNVFNEKIRVNGINLQKLLKEKYSNLNISFIKIDVEGNDCALVYSIRDIININKPNIMIEWIPGSEKVIYEISKIINYKTLNPKTLKEINVFKEDNIQDIILIPN